MNDIINIIKWLQDSCVLIDWVTVKHEFKKHDGGFLGVVLAPFAVTLVQPVISSLIKSITWIVVRRTRRGYNKIF